MRRLLILILVPLAACSTGVRPTAMVFQPVPRNSVICVIPLRDCIIPNNDDCPGSGGIAASVIAATLSQAAFRAMPLSRPGGPDQPLTDEQAGSLAGNKGCQLLINGEVNDFYRVAPGTFRADRASLQFRLLSVPEGEVVANAISSVEAGSNLGTPEGLIRKLAQCLVREIGSTTQVSRPSNAGSRRPL